MKFFNIQANIIYQAFPNRGPQSSTGPREKFKNFIDIILKTEIKISSKIWIFLDQNAFPTIVQSLICIIFMLFLKNWSADQKSLGNAALLIYYHCSRTGGGVFMFMSTIIEST